MPSLHKSRTNMPKLQLCTCTLHTETESINYLRILPEWNEFRNEEISHSTDKHLHLKYTVRSIDSELICARQVSFERLRCENCSWCYIAHTHTHTLHLRRLCMKCVTVQWLTAVYSIPFRMEVNCYNKFRHIVIIPNSERWI